MRIEWRDEEVPALRDPVRGEWVRLADWTRAVLEGLDRGQQVDEIRARVEAAGATGPRAEARLHRFLHSLARVGYLDVVVPLPARVGAYEVTRELGRGGVGVAYLARDTAMGQDVVLKRAWGFLNPLDATRAALAHEAKMLARLDHPHVVRGLGIVEEEGVAYLARELVRGRSVTERHGEAAPASRTEAARLALQAAEALAHVHSRGLLVVDQKPGNWYVEDDTLRLVLMDVGHAAEQDAAGAARARRGTPGFMPPEVLADGVVTTRSDVWGLGRLYAYARTGRMFRAGDVPLEDVVATLPEDEAAAVRIVCASDPSARPAGPREAAALLA